MKQRLPQLGDIYLLSMDPTLGTELQGMRPALVLTNSISNQHGRVLMARITNDRGMIPLLRNLDFPDQSSAPAASYRQLKTRRQQKSVLCF